MSDAGWIPYRRNLWHRQKLPADHHEVLLLLAPRHDDGMPRALAVGYMRFASGCKDSPQFIIPGIGGEVLAWRDCLPTTGLDFDAISALVADAEDTPKPT